MVRSRRLPFGIDPAARVVPFLPLAGMEGEQKEAVLVEAYPLALGELLQALVKGAGDPQRHLPGCEGCFHGGDAIIYNSIVKGGA